MRRLRSSTPEEAKFLRSEMLLGALWPQGGEVLVARATREPLFAPLEEEETALLKIAGEFAVGEATGDGDFRRSATVGLVFFPVFFISLVANFRLKCEIERLTWREYLNLEANFENVYYDGEW